MRWASRARASIWGSRGRGFKSRRPDGFSNASSPCTAAVQQYPRKTLKVCMRPLSGRHAIGGFKITTLGRGGFASRVLRVLRGSPARRTTLHQTLRGELLQHVSVGVVLGVAAALAPAVAGPVASCNTCGVTTRFWSIAELLEPSQCPVRPGLDPERIRVVRHERRTSLTASPGCWHAYPVGVSAVLTRAPGSSPWRLQSAHGGTPAYVTDGDGRAGMRCARSALLKNRCRR